MIKGNMRYQNYQTVSPEDTRNALESANPTGLDSLELCPNCNQGCLGIWSNSYAVMIFGIIQFVSATRYAIQCLLCNEITTEGGTLPIAVREWNDRALRFKLEISDDDIPF